MSEETTGPEGSAEADSSPKTRQSQLISRRNFTRGAAAVMGTGALAEAAAAFDELPDEAKAVQLEKSAEIEALMVERIITDDDIRRVIVNAEATGRKLYQPGSDHFLSKLRIGQVYFYVEYSKTGESAYKVHATWAHRFIILKEPY
ncbi:MAG: hypothetical protein LBT74_07260 [Acidobacteriota bacterium]|jgi:hypothetical protein|nr:hypothetical protein [Acidobacteriota bacterium]